MKFKVSNIDYYVPQSLLLTLVGTGTVTKRLQDVSISGNELTVTLTAAERTTLGSGNITVKLVVYSNMGTAAAQMQASFADLDNGTVITEMVLQVAADQGGAAHRNFLLNPFFTVNQRGQDSYTLANQYGFDCWQGRVGYAPTKLKIEKVSNGIKLSCSGGSNFPLLVQHIESIEEFKGKTITFSVNIKEFSGPRCRLQIAIDGTNYTVPLSAGIVSVSATVPSNANQVLCRIILNNSDTDDATSAYIIYDGTKLEVGAISTLMYDSPPDYETELLKCMRYFQRITSIIPSGQSTASYYIFGTGVAISATSARMNIPLMVPMRGGASVTAHNIYILRAGMTASALASAATVEAQSINGLRVAFTTSGMTAKEEVYAQCNHNGYLDITAEM